MLIINIDTREKTIIHGGKEYKYQAFSYVQTNFIIYHGIETKIELNREYKIYYNGNLKWSNL